MKQIAIVAGGDSSEYKVSLRSAATIMANIDRSLFEPYLTVLHGKEWNVEYNSRKYTLDKNIFGFTADNGKVVKFEYAYIIIHGTPGENGILEGYLDLMHIPYSTCGVLAGSLTFNKFMLNNLLKSFGVNVADSILLREGDTVTNQQVIDSVGLPCFIKPSTGGSSFGTTKVTEPEQIQPAIKAAFDESDQVIIEQFIKGKEFTSGYFKTKKREFALPITEVVPKRDFFDYDAKYNGAVEEITPARIPDSLRDRMQKLTAAIYKIVGCKGIVRNDYIVTEQDKIYLLEVNTTPGMTETSFVPQEIKSAGLVLKDVLTEIIEDGLSQ